MSGDSGGHTQTIQKTNADPWSGVQPYITKGLEGAETDVLNRPMEYFPDSGVVPFSPQSEAALTGMENRAVAGNPLNQQAQDEMGKVLGGEYLSSGNPYFSAMADRVTGDVNRAISGEWAGSGRYGSPGHTEAMARGMGDALAPIAFQNYGAERDRMMQGAAMAPDLAMTDYRDLEALRGVGGARESMAQAELGDEINRWNFEQQEPRTRLANYMALVQGGNVGGSSSSVTNTPQQSSSPILSGLGYGMMGLGMAQGLWGGSNPLFAKPWG